MKNGTKMLAMLAALTAMTLAPAAEAATVAAYEATPLQPLTFVVKGVAPFSLVELIGEADHTENSLAGGLYRITITCEQGPVCAGTIVDSS